MRVDHNNRRYRLSEVTYFLVASLLSGCIAAKFAPTNDRRTDGGAPRYADRILYTVTCQAEQGATKEVAKLPYKAEQYAFAVHPACEHDKEVAKEINHTKPLNIVVVVDRTGSMQQSIDAVKGGIIDFSKNLESYGWDAHFAAIGFRDEFHDFLIAPFANAASLRATIGSWKADGGSDAQEAGQKAIRHGYALLDQYTSQNPRRTGALNVILYVANGVAYWENDHSDFSMARLIDLAKGWRKRDPSLRFYYSVDPKLDPAKEHGLNAPTPYAQMQEFTAKAELPGKAVGFPLSREILNEFTKEFQQVTTATPLICQATQASLASSTEQGIPSRASLPEVFGSLSRGEPLIFQASPDIRTTDYTLTIERCCKKSELDKACVFTEERSIPLQFNQKT